MYKTTKVILLWLLFLPILLLRKEHSVKIFDIFYNIILLTIVITIPYLIMYHKISQKEQ